MLDQSFSAENFRIILDYENRKGVYLEGIYFPKIAAITEKIKKCNSDVRDKQKTLAAPAFDLFRERVNKKKEKLQKQKETALTAELEKISEKIADVHFRFVLDKISSHWKKPIYTVNKLPETFFALKQLQHNLNRLYKVKQSNRYEIISQVVRLLGDNFPKIIIRTDIKEFYESIPYDKLLIKLNKDNLLTFSSKKILREILYEYQTKSGSTCGIPRGVGVSAYLAELHMRDIDVKIKSLPNLTYYARYVDDMIAIFTPTFPDGDPSRSYLSEIENIVQDKAHGLELNKGKTSLISLLRGKQDCSFEYLGYKVVLTQGKVEVKFSKKKLEKLKKRTDATFEAYINLSRSNEKKARKMFLKRLRFLTGNTRLLNTKRNVLVGIYFSNSLLTPDYPDLLELDRYLRDKVTTLIKATTLKSRLDELFRTDNLSFQGGFKKRKFSQFTTNDLSEITKIWAYENQ